MEHNDSGLKYIMGIVTKNKLIVKVLKFFLLTIHK